MKTNKFKQRVQQFFANIKQIKIDKDNRERFLIDIKQEIIDPKSKFNKLGLYCNEDYTSISTILSIPDNYQLAGSDIMKYNKLIEQAQPVNAYINNILNWGEYFIYPEFFYIENIEESDDSSQNVLDEVSCSYIASWKYEPVLNKYPNFKKELAAFIGINTSILIGVITTILVIVL